MTDRRSANPVAFRAIRAILEAAHDCTVFLGDGRSAQVSVQALPGAGWPEAGLDGLDPERDGGWPPTIVLDYRWSDGRVRLRAQCEWWKTNDSYRHLVGITVRRGGGTPEVVWITFGLAIARTAEGEEAPIPATLGFTRHKDIEPKEVWLRRRQQLRRQAAIAELPLPSPSTVALCRVAVPSGEVLPTPAEAFERLARVALLKNVVLGRGDDTAFEGAPPYDLDSGPPVEVPDPSVKSDSEKRAGLLPLPGGVREYLNTLETLLRIVEEERPDRDALFQHLAERWNANGKAARSFYLGMLRGLGLVVETDGGFDLTDAGAAWLADPTGEALFPHLHANFTGILALLLLTREREPLTLKDADELRRMLDVSWESDTQISIRRNWLLSMGLTERDGGADRVTEAGHRVLAEHAEEAQRLLPLLEGTGSRESGEQDDDAVDERGEIAEVEKVAVEGAVVLSLGPDLVRRHLGNFRPPPRVIEQCCAALTSGRHLLLVGPPGTGKTELAGILAEAARSEEYCSGLVTATASADWTTFDTIGGYALDREGKLGFRPGLFPTALARGCWLLVDELNRADVDKAFGELMTVLSGKGTVTPYTDEEGEPIRIGPEPEAQYRVGPTFRVIATMNTWDKTSLFRLSSALQRRFAVIHVGLPSSADYAAVLQQEASREPRIEEHLTNLVVELFGPNGIRAHRAIGPAVPLDLLRYMRARRDEPRGRHSLAEGLAASLLSQLEGLDLSSARAVKKLLEDRVTPVSAPEAWTELSERLEELLPSMQAR